MNCMCDFTCSIDLMQMICVDKVIAEKSLDDSIREQHLFTTILVGVCNHRC
jgi:hypothetical protein